MNVLGICCSPRLHGNTETMLQESLKGAQEEGAEIELVTVAGKTISPCDACLACRKTGECHIKDDMQDIYPKLLEADGIIFGTPVYFWSVSAQAKALIDRTFAFGGERNLRNKAASVVITLEGSGASNTIAAFNGFFIIEKMIMVGYVIGVSGAEGYRDKEAVKQDKKRMAAAKALGKAMVKYIRSHKISDYPLT